MVLLRLDPETGGPLHERIAAAVRRAVADGEVGVGDTLPAARDLAEAVGVNVNTVLRAYRDLRDEGVVDLRRGRGATVRDAGVDRARLHQLADALLAEAARLGLPRAEVHALLEGRP
jgi:GntR family transcriptional regulator